MSSGGCGSGEALQSGPQLGQEKETPQTKQEPKDCLLCELAVAKLPHWEEHLVSALRG